MADFNPTELRGGEAMSFIRWLYSLVRPACVRCSHPLGRVWRKEPVANRVCASCLLALDREPQEEQK